MTIEQNLERIANALEKLAELKTSALLPVEAQTETKAQLEPLAQPEKKAPAKKAAKAVETPKVEAPKPIETPKAEVLNPLSDFNPATEFKGPVAPPQTTASSVTHKDVVEKLIAFAQEFGEDQAYAILTNFGVKKVKDLAGDQLQAVIDKLEKFRGLNL